jgi:hypothetical protein
MSHIISNQKRMREGIPSLLLWKIAQAGFFLKMGTSENCTIEIHRSQGPGVLRLIIIPQSNHL